MKMEWSPRFLATNVECARSQPRDCSPISPPVENALGDPRHVLVDDPSGTDASCGRLRSCPSDREARPTASPEVSTCAIGWSRGGAARRTVSCAAAVESFGVAAVPEAEPVEDDEHDRAAFDLLARCSPRRLSSVRSSTSVGKIERNRLSVGPESLEVVGDCEPRRLEDVARSRRCRSMKHPLAVFIEAFDAERRVAELVHGALDDAVCDRANGCGDPSVPVSDHEDVGRTTSLRGNVENHRRLEPLSGERRFGDDDAPQLFPESVWELISGLSSTSRTSGLRHRRRLLRPSRRMVSGTR